MVCSESKFLLASTSHPPLFRSNHVTDFLCFLPEVSVDHRHMQFDTCASALYIVFYHLFLHSILFGRLFQINLYERES